VIVQPYAASDQASWDAFVRGSKNGTFLFLRDYMDYHGDRFDDCSLVVRDDRHRVVALLPAHRDGETVISHGGLTYGGFVCDAAMSLGRMLEVVDASLSHLQAGGTRRLVYRTVPHIYHRAPAEEDRYALFAAGARWTRCASLAVIPPVGRAPYQRRRARGIKRAREGGLTVVRSTDIEAFWAILAERLGEAYHVRPVHSAGELRLLSERFPEHVKLFACYGGATMVAGVVVYETDPVARTQYIASTAAGRAMGAVDLLLDHLLTDVYPAKHVDLGTSEAASGGLVNRGLVEQKEGFGARAVGADQFVVDLADWTPGRLAKVLT
jgi:hypothetical protein